MAQELNWRVEHTYMRELYTPNNGEITNKNACCICPYIILPMQQNSYCMNLEHKYVLKREHLHNYFLVVVLCSRSSSKICLPRSYFKDMMSQKLNFKHKKSLAVSLGSDTQPTFSFSQSFCSFEERTHLIPLWIFLNLLNFTAISTLKRKLSRIHFSSDSNKNCPNQICVNWFFFILPTKLHLHWTLLP